MISGIADTLFRESVYLRNGETTAEMDRRKAAKVMQDAATRIHELESEVERLSALSHELDTEAFTTRDRLHAAERRLQTAVEALERTRVLLVARRATLDPDTPEATWLAGISNAITTALNAIKGES